MNCILPNNITNKIIIDSIILTKNINGWYNIHKIIREEKLFLKKKTYIFIENFNFSKITRLNTQAYTLDNIYLWFKKEGNFYIYRPKISYSINDIFSMDEYGNYLDDYLDYYNDTDTDTDNEN